MNSSPQESSGIGAGTVLRRSADGRVACVTDEVAIEEPLEIRVAGEPLATTMRTPGNDEELAIGFLHSEAVIRGPDDLGDCKVVGENAVEVTLAPQVKVARETMQRFGTISSSCGLCGKTNIDAIMRQFPPVESMTKIAVDDLLAMPGRLRSAQGNFARTGGLHAAALFDLRSDRSIMREDVGRHNAVDKVIGRAWIDQVLPLSTCALMVSGRTSFEIVQKALAAGLPIVASVSAPSSLAVNFAREGGITLIGFLRPPTFNVYSHVERLAVDR